MGVEWTDTNEREGYTMRKESVEVFIFVIIAALLMSALVAFTVWRDNNGMAQLEKQLSEQEVNG